jgi:hypothetical protein
MLQSPLQHFELLHVLVPEASLIQGGMQEMYPSPQQLRVVIDALPRRMPPV